MTKQENDTEQTTNIQKFKERKKKQEGKERNTEEEVGKGKK
jgi:hypothetical protein